MSPTNATRNTVIPTTYGGINKSRTGDSHSENPKTKNRNNRKSLPKSQCPSIAMPVLFCSSIAMPVFFCSCLLSKKFTEITMSVNRDACPFLFLPIAVPVFLVRSACPFWFAKTKNRNNREILPKSQCPSIAMPVLFCSSLRMLYRRVSNHIPLAGYPF